MNFRLKVLSFCLLGWLAVAGNALAQLVARPAEYEVIVRTNVMVAMRDGVKLSTDLYLPAKNGVAVEQKFPVLLTRSPYGNAGNASPAKFYAARGYVFVSQDTRGRYASEGVWHMITDDGRDGVDCAAWIGKQAWSNGKIGMLGTSYVGGTQHAMALERAPELATVIPVDAMSNLGRQSMRHAGAFEMRFWNWIMLNAGKGSSASRDPAKAAILKEMADNRLDYLKLLPLRKGMTPLRLAPEFEDWLVEAMNHGANDEFWAQNNIIDHPEKYKDVPVYLVGGWYDSWAGNTTANYAALSRTLKSPVYLIMGPWIHGQQTGDSHGQVYFGKNASIGDQWAWRLEWYDKWLKGMDNAVGKAAPFASKVRIFVMGTGDGHKTEKGLLNHGGYWREEQEWPLKRTVYTPFYLHPDGSLQKEKAEQRIASTRYQFDPQNPVPTIGGQLSSGDGIMVAGAWDQRGQTNFWNWPKPVPLSARNDVLVFQTVPLKENTEVTGEIEVKLWVSSTAPDTDFTAKLVDVYPGSTDYPNGFELLIGDAIVRARYRDGTKEEKFLKDGMIYPISIKLYPTANVFKQGHRIRVDISSSNFPRFDVNPNTGEPLNQNRRTAVATNSIYHGQQYPSCIVLPVVPKGK
jgi:putative CocE/NonD family hydrolase